MEQDGVEVIEQVARRSVIRAVSVSEAVIVANRNKIVRNPYPDLKHKQKVRIAAAG